MPCRRPGAAGPRGAGRRNRWRHILGVGNARVAPTARRDPRWCRPVAIVWPCPLAVDAYAAAGHDLGFPRPDCPSCAGPLVFWSGYRRYVREAGRYWKIFVPRLRCARCGVSHAARAAVPFITRRHVDPWCRATGRPPRPAPHRRRRILAAESAAAHDGEAWHRREDRLHPARQAQRPAEPGQEQEQEQERRARRHGPPASARPAPRSASPSRPGTCSPARRTPSRSPGSASAWWNPRWEWSRGTPGAGKTVALRTAVALDPTRHQVRSGSEPEHVAVRAARSRSRSGRRRNGPPHAASPETVPARKPVAWPASSLRIRAARGRGDIRGAKRGRISCSKYPAMSSQTCGVSGVPCSSNHRHRRPSMRITMPRLRAAGSEREPAGFIRSRKRLHAGRSRTPAKPATSELALTRPIRVRPVPGPQPLYGSGEPASAGLARHSLGAVAGTCDHRRDQDGVRRHRTG